MPEDADIDNIESYLHLQVLVVKVPGRTLVAERDVNINQKEVIDRILEKVGLE